MSPTNGLVWGRNIKELRLKRKREIVAPVRGPRNLQEIFRKFSKWAVPARGWTWWAAISSRPFFHDTRAIALVLVASLSWVISPACTKLIAGWGWWLLKELRLSTRTFTKWSEWIDRDKCYCSLKCATDPVVSAHAPVTVASKLYISRGPCLSLALIWNENAERNG